MKGTEREGKAKQRKKISETEQAQNPIVMKSEREQGWVINRFWVHVLMKRKEIKQVGKVG